MSSDNDTDDYEHKEAIMVPTGVTRTTYRSHMFACPGALVRVPMIALFGLAAALSLIAAVPAIAGASSVTATINVAAPATASVVVSPTAVTYGSCSGTNSTELTFPNGSCTAPATANGEIVVEDNGSAAETIDVVGGAAKPSSMNTTEQWMLCPSTTVNYSCSVMVPGQNEFSEFLSHVANGGTGLYLTENAACDEAFDSNGGCTAAAGEKQGERLSLTGPSKSTVSASTFTTQITWTAVSSSQESP